MLYATNKESNRKDEDREMDRDNGRLANRHTFEMYSKMTGGCGFSFSAFIVLL